MWPVISTPVVSASKAVVELGCNFTWPDALTFKLLLVAKTSLPSILIIAPPESVNLNIHFQVIIIFSGFIFKCVIY